MEASLRIHTSGTRLVVRNGAPGVDMDAGGPVNTKVANNTMRAQRGRIIFCEICGRARAIVYGVCCANIDGYKKNGQVNKCVMNVHRRASNILFIRIQIYHPGMTTAETST